MKALQRTSSGFRFGYRSQYSCAIHLGVDNSESELDTAVDTWQVYPHVCTVEDVAGSIAFLASNEAASITGHNLVVDCAITTGVGGAQS